LLAEVPGNSTEEGGVELILKSTGKKIGLAKKTIYLHSYRNKSRSESKVSILATQSM